MLDRLNFLENKYDELSIKISDPSIMQNQKEWQKLCKEHAELEELVIKYRQYKKALEQIEENKELLKEETDRDMKDMIQEDIKSLTEEKDQTEEELKILMLPKDPNDSKNVFIEIRGGAGGEEAALFASNLFRMYIKYAEKNGWKHEIMSSNETDIGGFKEVVLMVKGNGAYSKFKYESGVHRVQRVPDTESSGRIQDRKSVV